jgi:hypothetical protein
MAFSWTAWHRNRLTVFCTLSSRGSNSPTGRVLDLFVGQHLYRVVKRYGIPKGPHYLNWEVAEYISVCDRYVDLRCLCASSRRPFQRAVDTVTALEITTGRVAIVRVHQICRPSTCFNRCVERCVLVAHLTRRNKNPVLIGMADVSENIKQNEAAQCTCSKCLWI